MLTVTDLHTRFHTDAGIARAVDGVSFDVGAGEVLGIVGESGCGKSVTALSILRLVPEPPGEIVPGSSIRFHDRELLALSEREMRAIRGNDIAMIFQEPMTSLNPVFTVGDQIAEAIRLHRGRSRSAARREAVTLLRLVGIPDPEQRAAGYPHQLSGGQRQRVMIAIALSCEPALLIADEPTTALDVTIQAQILALLAELRARLGMAMILITHDLGVVAGTCDRVAVMYAGRIVEEAPATRIFDDPRHPYTQGLLRSIPRLDRRAERLAVIPGAVPSATHWPAGCRFRDRCGHAWERCAAEPPLVPIGPGRAARCWLELEPERRTRVASPPPGSAGAGGPGPERAP
jgi:oligopeptide/dipeptide ABC transporter ATP-binding protein